MNLISLKLAVQALLRQKTRAILTILGISIGIAIVITIMSAGRGLNKFVLGQLDVFSPNTLSIETKIPSVKKTSSENSFGQASGISITTMKEQDLEDLKKIPNIESAYGMVMGQAVVKYQSEKTTPLLMGEGYSMTDVESFNFDSGRMFTKEEEDSLAQVVVLGWIVKDKLFGLDEAVGKIIYIKGQPFRVVGVSEKRGAAFFMDMDNVVIIPTKTMQKRILGINYYRQMIAKMKDNKLTVQTVAEIEAMMRENHDITDPVKDDFAVNTMQEAASMLSSVIDGITLLLVALVCVSLVVGGVGIMNIMYVSVTERTFEIGLRKSLGAKNKDILWQFLLEAVLLTAMGAMAGIIIGALLSFIIYIIAVSNNFKWVFSIPLSAIVLSVGFSAGIGLLFGIYPANKAAKLDPIEALRRD